MADNAKATVPIKQKKRFRNQDYRLKKMEPVEIVDDSVDDDLVEQPIVPSQDNELPSQDINKPPSYDEAVRTANVSDNAVNEQEDDQGTNLNKRRNPDCRLKKMDPVDVVSVDDSSSVISSTQNTSPQDDMVKDTDEQTDKPVKIKKRLRNHDFRLKKMEPVEIISVEESGDEEAPN